jgi:hypothetical protein
METCRRFYLCFGYRVPVISVTALYLGHVWGDRSGFAVENPHLTAEKLHRLLCSSTGILAPDLGTVVEDT